MPPESLRRCFADAARVLDAFQSDAEAIATVDRCAGVLAECLRAGGKVLACGNGGSLCDAAHFAEELTGRFRNDRRPLAAIACADAGHITCTANDYGFEFVFSRWVEALGRKGDCLILLSTSGNSPNILRAADAGKAVGLTTISLLGKGGGVMRGRCTHEIVVPGETSDRIQELHMLILHAWVEGIEVRLPS
ncbi:MAG: phosphoheptose isomerase [Phycisphaerae bacterium]|nr:MAG: phosphoheptose isomerase [Phycisphaerae bacterium]